MSQSKFSKCECRHCTGHIEFPIEAGGATIACPHCGQPMELPNSPLTAKKPRSALALLIIALVSATVTASLMILLKHKATPSAPKLTTTPATNAALVQVIEEATTNGFAISALKLENLTGSSLVYVTGTIRNLNDRQRFGVKAEFSLLTTNGTAAGTASDYAATLEKNGVWKFKALVMESKAVRATLDFIREDQ
jgi:hypothetical protein